MPGWQEVIEGTTIDDVIHVKPQLPRLQPPLPQPQLPQPQPPLPRPPQQPRPPLQLPPPQPPPLPSTTPQPASPIARRPSHHALPRTSTTQTSTPSRTVCSRRATTAVPRRQSSSRAADGVETSPTVTRLPRSRRCTSAGDSALPTPQTSTATTTCSRQPRQPPPRQPPRQQPPLSCAPPTLRRPVSPPSINVFVSWDVDADHQVRRATVNTTAIEAFGDVFSNSTLFWESCNSGTDLVFADTDSGDGNPFIVTIEGVYGNLTVGCAARPNYNIYCPSTFSDPQTVLIEE